MTELNPDEVKKRSKTSVLFLVQRTFFIQIIGIVSTGLFAAFLSTEHWGIFGIVNSLIALLTYFSDIGLAGALIQKKEKITTDDLSTTFTIQQILVWSIIFLGLIGERWIIAFYKLNEDGIWLFRAFLFSLFLSSLKTIPSILLERSLRFEKLVIPQILEALAFNFVTVLCAWRGFGVASFTYGVMARAIVGLVAMYTIAPWRIRVGIHMQSARRLISYGIPFQSNSFLALLKDDLMILFLGKVFPINVVGIIAFAKKVSELPLRTIMDNVTKVTFPAFARLQHDKEVLGNALNRTVFGISACVFPLYTGMIFFFSPVVELIPKYQKWEGAFLSFVFFCLASIPSSISTPLTNALNAVGKIHITLYFMIGWLISTWIFVLFFINLYGFHGFAFSLMLISLISIFIVGFVVNRIIPFDFFRNIASPLFSVIPQAIVYIMFLPVVSGSLLSLCMLAGFGVMVYLAVLWKFDKHNLSSFVRLFIQR
ncbi:MAG: oligosaccharide flippase family protein [Patescibacteria group bacterium]|nr:oligosaccharide flippase family protein [Patescibacteria group bacterium]